MAPRNTILRRWVGDPCGVSLVPRPDGCDRPPDEAPHDVVPSLTSFYFLALRPSFPSLHGEKVGSTAGKSLWFFQAAG